MGSFASRGPKVTVWWGNGTLAAIPKMTTGAFPVGMAEINSLITFPDQNPGAAVIAAMRSGNLNTRSQDDALDEDVMAEGLAGLFT